MTDGLSDLELWSELYGEDGNDTLGKAGVLPNASSPADSVRLDETGTWLLWTPRDSKSTANRSPIRTDGLLGRFKDITTGDDVLRFARTNGPLQICHHGITSAHNRPPEFDRWGLETYPSVVPRKHNLAFAQARISEIVRSGGMPPFTVQNVPEPPNYCLPMIWDEESEKPSGLANFTKEPDLGGVDQFTDGVIYGEPIEIWFRLVAQIQSALRIIVDFRRGEPGRDEDWHRLEPLLSVANAPNLEISIRQHWLATTINEWVRIGNTRPALVVSGEFRSSVHWHSSPFGLLAVQLLGVFRGAGTLAVCFECGDPYSPLRTPKVNQSNFCQKNKCKSASSKYRKRVAERKKNAK